MLKSFHRPTGLQNIMLTALGLVPGALPEIPPYNANAEQGVPF